MLPTVYAIKHPASDKQDFTFIQTSHPMDSYTRAEFQHFIDKATRRLCTKKAVSEMTDEIIAEAIKELTGTTGIIAEVCNPMENPFRI